MIIKYTKALEGSEAFSFAVRAWQALRREGLWDKDAALIGGLEQCFYAVIKGRIVGCLAFHVGDTITFQINVVYVTPRHRKLGIYKALHEAFEREAKKQGARAIGNICKPTNKVIQAACRKQGYLLHSEEWRKKL